MKITSIGVSEAFGNVAVAEFGVNVLVVTGVIGISIVHFKILNYYFYRRVLNYITVTTEILFLLDTKFHLV